MAAARLNPVLAASLLAMGAVGYNGEPVVQGTRLEDWWQATEAGKAYLKSLGSRVP